MYKKNVKRILDIVLSFIALPVATFISLVLIPLIYIEDRGSPFYVAPRLGLGGRTFWMYKFRSMRVGAPDIRNDDGTTFNSKKDPRVTKVGKIMREMSLDELPQLINIIKGEMSIIGPRPDLPDALDVFVGDERKKLDVLPGLTGYCQAYYRNNIDLHERFRQDAYYAENISFVLDVKILIRTVIIVLSRRSVYRNAMQSQVDTKPQVHDWS